MDCGSSVTSLVFRAPSYNDSYSTNGIVAALMQAQATTHRPDTNAAQAAIRIQRAWRRKLATTKSHPQLEFMDANSRWKDAAIHAQMKVL